MTAPFQTILMAVGIAAVAAPPAEAAGRTASLEVVVKEVFQGRSYDPEHVRIAVFDARKAGKLLRLATDYDLAASQGDAAFDRLLHLRDRLAEEIAATPALARSSTRRSFRLANFGRVVVFAAVSGEGEEMAILHGTAFLSPEHPYRLRLNAK